MSSMKKNAKTHTIKNSAFRSSLFHKIAEIKAAKIIGNNVKSSSVAKLMSASKHAIPLSSPFLQIPILV